MTIHRREFLMGTAAFAAVASAPGQALAQVGASPFRPKPEGWRRFDIVTRLEVKPQGETRAWIPLPSVHEAEWSRPMGNLWTTNATRAAIHRDPKSNAEFLRVEWAASEAAPVVEVQSRFASRDRAIDLSKPGQARPLSAGARKYYTSATALLPTDGIVKETAEKITAGATTDMQKAQRLYDWVVENTARNGQTRGCGVGDIASMLKSGNLTGKCADLNALYVGLARASGLPARDVYGLRVAPSKFGYKSLGTGSDTITRAQHCRAEVHLAGFGWVPVDPADVRKVVLEEPPGNLALNNDMVVSARKGLFGSWEGNWLAYNDGHDIVLPGAKGPTLDFLMYPQAETVAGRLDCLDPDNFRYTIKVTELAT